MCMGVMKYVVLLFSLADHLVLKDKAAVENLQWTIVTATEKITREKFQGQCFHFANLLVKLSDLQALCWGRCTLLN